MAVKSHSISTQRVPAWCFLASIIITSMEGLGYFTLPHAGAPLSFTDFSMRLANTCALMLIAFLVTWCFLWFFMVWLGGVRRGMALFFMILFFTVFCYLVIVLDMLFAYTTKFEAYWALLMRYFALFAFLLAALSSLILGKVFHRDRPLYFSPRLFTILAVGALGFVFAVWLRNVRFQDKNGALFWGGFIAALTVVALLLWWLGKNHSRLAILQLALFVLILTPLLFPLFSKQSAPSSNAAAHATSHPIRHIVLITVDTLRQDALGCYNSAATNTPHIDQLAGGSAAFTNAFSSSPWTYPSVTSILTGLAPQVHTLVDGKTALPEKVPTLAAMLESAGYYTAAFGLNGMLKSQTRLDRGFKEYNWYPAEVLSARNFEIGLTHNLMKLFGSRKPNAAGLTDQATEWIKKHAQQDFFLWVHYFEPHMPYAPPAQFQPIEPAFREKGNAFMHTRGARMGSVARTAEERAWVRALYEGEVRYVDSQIGRFMESLRQVGIYEDALILFTADHGEELWDHDHFEHGHTLFNELIQVPLLVKLPGTQTGSSVEAAVSNQAIAPTILELCGIALPADQGMPPSFSPLLQNPSGDYMEVPIFSGASIFHDQLEGVIFDRMKYIRGKLSGHEFLFNLQEDPEERTSLTTQDPVNLERGRQLLEAAQASDARVRESLDIQQDEKDRLHHEEIRSLEALGYL